MAVLNQEFGSFEPSSGNETIEAANVRLGGVGPSPVRRLAAPSHRSRRVGAAPVLGGLVWLSASLALACNTGGEVLSVGPGTGVPDAAASDETTSDETTSDESSIGETNSGAPDAGAPLAAASAVAAGTDHSCALQSGAVFCSGANVAGQLGVAAGDPPLMLVQSQVDEAVVELEAGYGFTCVRYTSGSVACFGDNAVGQLGTGDGAARATPQVVDLPSTVKAVATKFATVCVVLEASADEAAGAVYCWGANDNNQCGTGTFVAGDGQATPVRANLDLPARDISVGRGHTCVITEADELWCWGSNGSHELGLGPDAPGLTVQPDRISDLHFAQVANGQNHTCALTTDHALYCWGDTLTNDGHPGPMGHDDGVAHDVPTRVGAEADWALIATDTFHSCGIRNDGELWCWGRNAEGQLGVGSQDVVPERVQVNPNDRFSSVAVGRFHTCALRVDGVVLCAGKNDNGELASGDVMRRWTLTPMAVRR